MTKHFLVSVGRDIVPEALKALTAAYGEIGQVTSDLFTVHADGSVDDIKAIVAAAAGPAGSILVAEVTECSFRGNGQVAYAAGVLRR